MSEKMEPKVQVIEQDVKSKFDKVLNKREVFALAFGAMIGWGWVVLAGEWILRAGAFGAMLAFVLGGVMVLFVGLTYAELTTSMPKCGGEMVFSLRALGKGPSFITTWAIILGYVGVVAFEACAFPTIIQFIQPDFMQGYMYTIAEWDVYGTWVAAGVIASIVITFINYIGVKPAAVLNAALVYVIAAIGIVLMGGSLVNGDIETAKPLFDNGMGGFFSVVVMTPFMFVGFDVLPQSAEEINVPPKKVGKILLLSIAMAVVWYVAIIFCVSYVMTKPELEVTTLATADAMKNAYGADFMANVLIIGGLAGIVTTWNAFFVGGSRALYAMAEANMLPRFLAKLHPKYKTPTNAILLIGVISCIAPFFGRVMMVWLTDAGSFSVVIAYMLVAASFLKLRRDEPNLVRPYRAPYGSLVGILAVGMSIFMLVLYMPGMPSGLIPQEWVIFGIWLALGVIFGVAAKAKYGSKFGEQDGLLYPAKRARLIAEQIKMNGHAQPAMKDEETLV